MNTELLGLIENVKMYLCENGYTAEGRPITQQKEVFKFRGVKGYFTETKVGDTHTVIIEFAGGVFYQHEESGISLNTITDKKFIEAWNFNKLYTIS